MIYPHAFELYTRLSDAKPLPQTELKYKNAYTLMVAVILSAQATDKGVNKATDELFDIIDTPEKMVALGFENLREYIKTINFNNNKAKNIIKASEILIQHHQGNVPDNYEALEALPGVGRKTANVILNVAFGKETIAVDTHIFRVANRTGLAPGKTPLEVELKLLEVTPSEFRQHAHHWLILHGRYICVARKPKCDICVLKDICDYYLKNSNE